MNVQQSRAPTLSPLSASLLATATMIAAGSQSNYAPEALNAEGAVR